MVFNLLNINNKQLAAAKIAIYNSLAYRQSVVRVCNDFYEGRQADYLYDDLSARDPQNADQYYLSIFNITKLVIDDTSLITKTEPIRKIANGTAKDDELWAADQKLMQYGSRMVDTEKQTKLTGSPLVAVHWKETDTSEKTQQVLAPELPTDLIEKSGHPVLDIITYDAYDARWSCSNEIEELLYPVEQGLFFGFDNKGLIDARNRINLAYWSNDVFYTGNEGEKGKDEVNPYNMIPVVIFHRHQPINFRYCPCDEALIYDNNNINLQATIGGFVSRYQIHSQPVMEDGQPLATYQADIGGQSPVDELGSSVSLNSSVSMASILRSDSKDTVNAANEAGGTKLGPNSMVYGRFKYENPSPNLMALLNWIESQLKWVASTHNLDSDRFVKQIMGPQSGAAIWAGEVRAEQAAKQERPQMAYNEKKLFQVIKRVRNSNAPLGEQYSEECELEITYKDNESPMTPQEKFEYLMLQYEKGFMGPIEVIQKLYPYMDEAEAIAKFTKIQDEKRMYQTETEIKQEEQDKAELNKASMVGANEIPRQNK